MNELCESYISRANKFWSILGEDLGYTNKECKNCGRLRVIKYSSKNEICEKCGFEQNTEQYYENEYGRYDEML